MNILVLNAGSSSLKYQLFEMNTESVLAKGLCERIGIDGVISHKPQVGDKPNYKQQVQLDNHAMALEAVMNLLTSKDYGVLSSMTEIDAVGHRVVHGGEYFASSVLITDEVMQALEVCTPLAPLHNPANITGIESCRAVLGDIPQVALFDTAFHQTVPKKAFTYAIPHKYYDDYKIRKYGFHGASHRYVSCRAAEMLGKPLSETKLISCHMGNGSSVCAILGGISIDTSMGFTPLDGLPMGTRCGDIDSGVLQYIMDRDNLSIDEMMEILNKKSGVLGISGISSDFRDIEDEMANGNERAMLALDVFYYHVGKTIGSYAAALDGVDAIIFTAGIGENSPEARIEISQYLHYLNCHLDHEANKVRGKEAVVSTPDSTVKMLVIPTNEELIIARDTKAIIDSLKAK